MENYGTRSFVCQGKNQSAEAFSFLGSPQAGYAIGGAPGIVALCPSLYETRNFERKHLLYTVEAAVKHWPQML
jgi:hypothetical protein